MDEVGNHALQLLAGDLQLTILPRLGGSIARFDRVTTEGAVPLLRGGECTVASPLDCGSFPLVPFCNRIRGGSFRFRGRQVTIAPNMAGDPSPLHGFGWQAPWTVEAADGTSATLAHRHDPGEWPWAYLAWQSFALDPDGLTSRLRCRNVSEEPMPCGLGFHPYFPCEETVIRTGVARVWTIDADVLPVEAVPALGRYALSGEPACGRDLDNGYEGWDGAATLHYPRRSFDLRMSSPDARFFQLYSPPDGSLFVAEPVTHRNAALNEPEKQWTAAGLRVLGPGEEMELEMRIELIGKSIR